MEPKQIAIIIGASVVMILLIGVILSILIGQRQAKRERAMAVIAGQAGGGLGGDSEADKEKEIARNRAEIARKLKQAGEAEKKEKGDRVTTQDLILQAGLETSIAKFWVFSLLFGFMMGGMVYGMGLNPVAQIGIVITSILGIPRIYLKKKAAKRQKKFLEDFSDALEAMVRLLQAGMPVTEAVAMVSREHTGPVSEEMMRLYEDQKVGISISDAAARAARRMPITEMQMFATALQIQSETGSSLSEVLSNLAEVIRSRFRLKRKVKALAAEAKAGAIIIGILPFVVTLGLYAVAPDYITPLFVEQKGKMMLYAGLFWMSCGIFIMRAMINFKV